MESAAGGMTLADRLSLLFEKIRKEDGAAYSLREVAEAVTAAGEPISHTYIAQLRTGKRVDPTLSHLRGLARFFGVPVEFFTSDEIVDGVSGELELLSVLNSVRARTVALRQSVLPDAVAAVDALTKLIAQIHDLERRAGAPDAP